jgi:hypothetical protein
MQRKQQTLEGLLQHEDKKRLIELHRNAQRLLRPLLVANPFAEQLTFIDDKTRTRRDHMKYLTLIRSIALLHQYQREVKTVEPQGKPLHYIEVTKDDIEMANRLAHEVLGRTLDELPPQTRKLLKRIHQLVSASCEAEGIEQRDYRFSRKDVREATGWGDTQLKIHLARLAELEYVLIHRHGQAYRYELLFQGEGASGKALAMNLIDAEKLGYDNNRSGLKGARSGGGRPLVGGQSGSGREEEISENPTTTGLNGHERKKGQEKVIEVKNAAGSCRSPSAAPLSR